MDKEKNSAAHNTQELALDAAQILQQVKDLMGSEDTQDMYEMMDTLKARFYQALDGSEELAAIEQEFKILYADFKARKKAAQKDMEKVKEENFVIKQQIVEELKVLLEKTEDVTHTFPAFRELQNRWKSVGAVPQAKAKELLETYQHYVEKFYDYIKINNEFRDMDFRKNMEAKTALCERAEELAQQENVVEAFKELQKLHEQWKETGPVAKEHRELMWDVLYAFL